MVVWFTLTLAPQPMDYKHHTLAKISTMAVMNDDRISCPQVGVRANSACSPRGSLRSKWPYLGGVGSKLHLDNASLILYLGLHWREPLAGPVKSTAVQYVVKPHEPPHNHGRIEFSILIRSKKANSYP